jgi:hypothetical protein
MTKRIKILAGILLFIIVFWRAYPRLQLFYFNRHKGVNQQDLELYNRDKQALTDTIISWKDFKYSPAGFNPKHWWIDTIIYTDTKDRLLAIVNVYSDPQGEMPYNFSKWVLGIRKNNTLSFLVSAGSQFVMLIDPTDSTRETLSKIGRRELMVYLYYPCTVSQRKNFWSALFNKEDIMINMQKEEIEKWENEKKQIPEGNS